MERAALQRGESFARERLAAIDEHGVFRAVQARALGNGGDVRLVVLAEVGGERVRNRAALAHPRERTARVEAAGERDADALADRERGEDHAREREGVDAHTVPSIDSRLQLLGELRARRRLARDEQHGVLAGDRPGDARMVRDVDRLGERARISVRRRHDDEIAARLDRERPAPERDRERVVHPRLGRARRRVDEPAARVPDLDQAELVNVAGDRGLHDLVPGAAQCFGKLGLRSDRPLVDESKDRGMTLGAIHRAVTSLRISSARSTSSALATSGGARRRTFGPDDRHTRPASSAASSDRLHGRVELGADQQAGAAHVHDTRQRCEAGPQPFAVRADLLQQLVVDRVAHRDGGGADDGVAAEGRAVVARLERARRIVRDEQAADRQAVRERLGKRHELRPDAELLEREEAAGAAHARLHLVEREQRAELLGQRRSRREERRLERDHAALAEHRLEEDQPDVVGRGRVQRVDVVRARETCTGHERLERRALRGLAGHGERARRPAVEALLERDHARLAGRLARVLDRGLVRLGAGVAEERLRTAEPLRQALREHARGLGAVEVRRVPQLVELRVRGGERRRVAMAEPDDGDAAGEVEVATSGLVDQPHAVALDERDARLRIRREHRAGENACSCDHRRRSDLGDEPALRGVRRGEQLRDDAALERAVVDERRRAIRR